MGNLQADVVITSLATKSEIEIKCRLELTACVCK